MIGQVLGHCRIAAKIGEGGMGTVYRAHDEVLHRDVAVKVVNQSQNFDPAAGKDLLQEARASSALSHPNICTIHEVGESNGELYIVMELIEGQTLHTLSAETGLPADAVLRYGLQIASALGRAHDRGIVHRDLKSANILVTPEGLVKVLDFGLAKHVGAAVFDGSTKSFATPEETHGISGTLPYMAPEIFRGEPGDCRGDLWALGVVLYEAASGHLPFEGRTGFEISSAILRDLPKPLGPPAPPALWAVIQRCLVKEPAQRYQTAGEVQAALAAVQSGAILAASQSAERVVPRTTFLHNVRHVPIKKGDFVLFVGTTKGAFILRSNVQRSRWEIGGPYLHGESVYALAYDDRAGRHRIWASTRSYWGTMLRSSDDFGKSWVTPQEATIRFPPETGLSLNNIWQITLGPKDEPDLLYCGVEPAALFESRDDGETWSLVRGLFDHPHRPRWMPGNGGLALHTILLDPEHKQRMYVAISAGGVYRTDDGGMTWMACNRGIRSVNTPNKYPEFGQCIHKIALHPERPERLFLQSHWGLYRSDDHAETWTDIANGVPSDFGFPVVMHPGNPDCAFIVPVDSDQFRCTCDGRLRVYRTRNAGGSWEPLMRGLPQKDAYETVLREGLVTDALSPLGMYLGTRSGQLFVSRDEGKTWHKILEGLPPVLCIRNTWLQDASPVPERAASKPKPAKSSSRSRAAGSTKSRSKKR